MAGQPAPPPRSASGFARHRLPLIAWLVGLTLVAPFAALAAPLGSAKDIASFKLTNKTGQAAKEFHLVITSATDDFQLTKIRNEPWTPSS